MGAKPLVPSKNGRVGDGVCLKALGLDSILPWNELAHAAMWLGDRGREMDGMPTANIRNSG